MASRTKRAVVNTSCEMLLEVVAAVCGLILPRLILSHFGSAYNGITSSIGQFIGCVALLKSGIGSVTRAALYKPLAEHDSAGISEVANATVGFMRKIALVFLVSVAGFACVYPFLVSDSFGWLFSATLVLVLSISTFAQYFFGITYQMVLEADQRNYVVSLTNVFATILNTLFASFLILQGCGIHAVKLGSAAVFVLPPVFYNLYVTRRYRIDRAVRPNYTLISQRWDAFGHQLANFVNTNTDIILATVFLGVKEVSVYAVYHLAGNAVKKAIRAIGTGTTSAFGNMLAKNETERLKKRFTQYEILIFYVSSVLLISTGVLLTPFVGLYTHGIADVNYIRPLFGILVCLSIFVESVKLPYQQLVYAAGEFKKTRNGAYAEAALNIGISLLLIQSLGLNGIVIGTVLAISYRIFRYHAFICRHVLVRRFSGIFVKFLYSILCCASVASILFFLPARSIDTSGLWLACAFGVFALVAAVCTLWGVAFFRHDMGDMFRVLLGTCKKIAGVHSKN